MLRSAHIPEPEYIAESVDGAIYESSSGMLLVVGELPPGLIGRRPLLKGSLVIRYGLTLFVPTGNVLIPGLFAAERGGFLVGRAAWDFIQGNFTVHARADLLGMLLNGKTAQALIREVDFGVPVRVLVYDSPDARIPVIEINTLFVGKNAPPLPELLPLYLPAVADLDLLL